MIALVKNSTGKKSAVNFSVHSWDSAPVEGDDSKVRLTLDNGKEYIMEVSSFDKLVAALGKSDGFISID